MPYALSPMRVYWSALVVCALSAHTLGCSSSSNEPATSDSNGGSATGPGGVLGGGGIVGGGGVQANGGVGNGGFIGNSGAPATGGFLNGNGGMVVANGGTVGNGGGFATGGIFGNGGNVATGGFVGNGGSLVSTGGAPPGTGGGNTTNPYPPGPYVQSLPTNTIPNMPIPDLQLSGYVNPTAVGIANTKPFTNLYTMDDLRASGVRYALLHNSEFG
jgi:hypothetical protein